MSLTGSCAACGRVGTLFHVESAGVRLCGPCVAMQVSFAGEVVDDRRRAFERSDAAPHDQVHVVGIGSCPACRARWGWV